jgi:regulator of sigma E protease
LIALISVNLAVFNLLPIPILDGGQIMVNILEAIKGSAFSARTREYILRAGLAAVLLLFALVTYNDLRRLVLGLIKHFG